MLMMRTGRIPQLEWPKEAPWREECESLCGHCLEYDPEDRPGMHEVAESLRGWLSKGDVAKLDAAFAMTLLPCQSWSEGQDELRRLSDASANSASVQMEVDYSDGFNVLSIQSSGVPPACGYPAVGESFLDWVESSEDFRVAISSTVNDLRLGVKIAPFTQMWSGLRFRCPAQKGGPVRVGAPWVFCFALFLEGCDRIVLRLCEPAHSSQLQLKL